MSRVLSITSSLFAASFIVLMFLSLLAWVGAAALADEPLSSLCQGSCDNSGEHICPGGDCSNICCCSCASNCDCIDYGAGDDCLGYC